MKNLLFFLLCLPLASAAQNFHFSARFGLSGYQGDLKEKSLSLSQSKLMGSFGARYDMSEKITLRSYFTYTNLQADDKKGSPGMQQRNLNFKTRLFDWELTAQYNIFSLNYKWWTPYVYAGIGVFRFNPYTEVADNQKVYLQPLSTEGQGFRKDKVPYSLTQISLPLGIGLDYSLGEDSRIGFEIGYRKIYTDYLDDVSTSYADRDELLAARGQTAVDLAWRGDEVGSGPYPSAGTTRGNPANKDGYFYFGVTYTLRYFFDKYKQVAGIPGGSRDKRVGCPGTRY